MLALKFCIGKFSGVWHLQAWNQQPLPHGDHRPHQRIKQLRTRERKDAGVTAKFRFSDCPSCSPVGILALRRESGSFSPVPWLHVILASNSVSSSPHRCQWWGKGRHSGQRGDTLLGLLGREKDRHVSWATLLSRIFSCAKWIQYGSIQRRDCEPPDLSLVSSTQPWLYTCQCLLFAYRLKRKILNLDQSHAESGPIALSGHPPSFHIGEWLSYVMAKFQSSLMP